MEAHRRIQGDLVLSRLGLLSDEEQDALDEHVRSCRDCRETLETLASGEDADRFEGHLPGALVARWDTLKDRLGELERDVVGRHLEQCRPCREEIELLGMTPALGAAAPPRPESEAGAGTSVIRIVQGGSRFRWRAQGALAGLAAAAAVLILILPRGSRGPEEGILPWVAPGTVRGQPHTVEVPGGIRSLLLAVPVPPELGPGVAGIRLHVEGPGGELLMDLPVEGSVLDEPTLMTLLQSDTPLEAGTYTVRYRDPHRDESPTYFFRIRLAP